ncbi:hypothetical protein, partial [Streptomyces sp. H27-C3]|uniref:hypothetical protein n=1 Tax=Streptomyces sp. H27-C3 TaxID=3046305 RepID=UPI0024BBCB3C
MARAHRFHLDVADHSVTVLTRHDTRETELLVDGKVVGYQRVQARHRRPKITLTGELPGDPPQPFDITLHTSEPLGDAPTCILELAGRMHPMPQMPPGRVSPVPHDLSLHPLRQIRRLLRRRTPR